MSRHFLPSRGQVTPVNPTRGESRACDTSSFAEWRSVTAPPDFAARVVGLALGAQGQDDSVPRSVHTRVRVRAWPAGLTLALALGASAAAALSFGYRTLRETAVRQPAAVLEPAVIERPAIHAAQRSMDDARSERNIGAPKPIPSRSVGKATETRPALAELSEEHSLLPEQLHVPPCQCTLSAVLCSCVE